jgi:hypothetical protein
MVFYQRIGLRMEGATESLPSGSEKKVLLKRSNSPSFPSPVGEREWVRATSREVISETRL